MTHERLTYLLNGFSGKSLTTVENKELKDFLDGLENSQMPEELIGPLLEEQPARFADYLTGDKIQQVLQQVFEVDKVYTAASEQPGIEPVVVSGSAEPPVHFFKTNWLRYAAAVIVLIGAGAVFYSINKSKEQSLAIDNQQLPSAILPGGEKATLTLADGTKISLDSAANGKLTTQGGVKVIKLSDGQLAYDLGGHQLKEELWNTMSTPKGGNYQVVLPDGTKVWLNAASSIKFPAAFTGAKRNVVVSGEVYMEVAQDKGRPFIVDVNGRCAIQVLGTSFNIDSYGDEDQVRSTLISGSIKILPHYSNVADGKSIAQDTEKTSAANSILLKPGQQAILRSADQPMKVVKADLEQVLAWKNGIFNFQHADLRSLMKQVERWYDVTVMYKGSVPKIEFGGKVDRGVTLTDLMEFLKGFGVDTRLEGKTLIVL